MRKFLTAAAAGAALSLAAAIAPASAIDFEGTFEVTDYNTDSGLIIDVDPSSGPVEFDLNFVGDSETENLFWISTPEDDVGGDDTVWQPIEVAFNFTSPDLFGGTVGGNTNGESEWGWVLFFLVNWQNGTVDWNGPSTFDFGNGGKLSVSLNDTEFGQGKYGLSDKSAKVKATFTLDAMPSAVPEPATWAMMITGFGLAGVALRRRRSLGAIAA